MVKAGVMCTYGVLPQHIDLDVTNVMNDNIEDMENNNNNKEMQTNWDDNNGSGSYCSSLHGSQSMSVVSFSSYHRDGAGAAVDGVRGADKNESWKGEGRRRRRNKDRDREEGSDSCNARSIKKGFEGKVLYCFSAVEHLGISLEVNVAIKMVGIVHALSILLLLDIYVYTRYFLFFSFSGNW